MSKIVPGRETLYLESEVHVTDHENLIFEECLRKAQSDSPSFRRKKFLFVSDPVRIKWDLFIIFLVIIQSAWVPFSISFKPPLDSHLSTVIVLTVIDVCFMTDIYLNFKTSYIDIKTGEEITLPREIARNYVQSWRFLFDVFSAIPLDLITMSSRSAVEGLHVVKFLKLVRLFRISTIMRFMRAKVDIKISISIVNIILCLLIYLHVLACAWHGLVGFERKWEQPTEAFFGKPHQFFAEDILHRYMFSFYAAIATLLTFEIFPQTKFEYLFCMICVLIGAMVMSYLLGEITLLVSTLSKTKTNFFNMMDKINAFMKKLRLPEELQDRITKQFVKNNEILVHHKEYSKFQKIVPPSLITQVNMHVYDKLVRSQPVFAAHNEEIQLIVKGLVSSFLIPDLMLIQRGDKSDFFCFVVKGKLEVWTKGLDGKEHFARKLSVGDYCGEVGLLHNTSRTASVKSSQYSNIGVLSADLFDKIVVQNEEICKKMKTKISFYNDPYRINSMRFLKRLPYLRNLDRLTLTYLIYSLQPMSFDPSTYLFEEEACLKSVCFIIEGSVSLYMKIRDSRLKCELQRRDAAKESEISLSFLKKKRSSVLGLNLLGNKYSYLKLESVGPGSIIGGVQALLHCQVPVFYVSEKPTKVLMLRTSILDRLSATNTRLRLNMINAKKKYVYVVPKCEEIITIPPVMDCFKCFSNEPPEEIRSWKLRLKFKNAVLMVINRNRHNLKRRLGNLKELIYTVRAIAFAEGKKRFDVARKIENSKLTPKSAYFAHLLYTEELDKPRYLQLALLTKQALNTYTKLKHKNEQVDQVLRAISERKIKIDQVFIDIQEIVKILQRYII